MLDFELVFLILLFNNFNNRLITLPIDKSVLRGLQAREFKARVFRERVFGMEVFYMKMLFESASKSSICLEIRTSDRERANELESLKDEHQMIIIRTALDGRSISGYLPFKTRRLRSSRILGMYRTQSSMPLDSCLKWCFASY